MYCGPPNFWVTDRLCLWSGPVSIEHTSNVSESFIWHPHPHIWCSVHVAEVVGGVANSHRPHYFVGVIREDQLVARRVVAYHPYVWLILAGSDEHLLRNAANELQARGGGERPNERGSGRRWSAMFHCKLNTVDKFWLLTRIFFTKFLEKFKPILNSCFVIKN